MDVQPCLFCGGDPSAPDHRARCDGRQGAVEAALPTEAEARALRDAVITATQAAAGPTFSEQAEAVILQTLAEGPASSELLTITCRRAGITPRKDDRAFGGVYMRLARAGRIEKAGTVKRVRGHYTSGGNVWRLVS